ncbi:DUF817 domain-containing protein [Paracoccus tegillarcae]|uniref:DUF817 domain-containing protein n=2 Tax=Paracoccus tegillarcae TaxID=1529068 RepID=A0A2K9EM01_9RHOB|nr:DUF817 domain-containing protein [Paracoccus tegillarcae]AUH35479.1 DUF817 domain-containing protein [Paracoccus tegillarcae]
MFTLKMGWAALFGGLLLIAILVSKSIWQPGWPVERYDALFLFAISVQALFLIFRLESWAEARVILLFHLTGTAMELFKTWAGSWSYPEAALFRIEGVPLFSGFMYASVGSFMARAMRIFDMRFRPYPPFWLTVGLAVAIYVNFFAHHFLPDIRWLLFAATIAIYGRTWVWFRLTSYYRMPLVLAAGLSSLFLWIAENIGTRSGTWLYAGQHEAQMVSFAKMGSWYLLLYVSFVTVTLAAPAVINDRAAPSPRSPQPPEPADQARPKPRNSPFGSSTD